MALRRVKRNPGADKDPVHGIYREIDRRKAEGKRRAEAHKADIERQAREGRGGPGGGGAATDNMIRALKLFPWSNTVEDWERYFSALIYKRALSRARSSHVRRNPAGPREADHQAARELMLYITNDRDLYRQRAHSIIRSMQRKRKAGKHDPKAETKAWMYLADAGAAKYTREFGARGDRTLFDLPTRWATAKLLQREYAEEIGD